MESKLLQFCSASCARLRAAPRRRRPSAPPARGRSTTAPSSARRCSGRSRTPAGSRAPRRGRRAPLPGSVTATNCVAVAAGALVEVLHVRQRLDRAAGLRGDDEQRLRQVDACPRARSTAPGSVESSTCSVEPVGESPKLRRITSGPRLEPPMPSSAASVKPVGLAPRSTNAVQVAGAARASRSAIVSQPRRSPISGPGPPQSVSSLRQMRRGDALRRPPASTRSAIAGSSSSGSDGLDRRRAGR